jgi:Tol biopolymer transport system component/uncharacterized protein YjdB
MHRRPLHLSMLVALITAATVACNGDPTGSPAPVASMTVTPSVVTLTPGQSVPLTAVARDAADNDLDRPVTWKSLAEEVATVSPAGMVQAHAVGSATITASSGGKQAAATITVTTAAVTRVALSAAAVSLTWDGTQQLVATAYDVDDNVLDGRSVFWGSGNPAIASVSPTGLVEAHGEGLTQVWATIEGAHADAIVEVARAPVAQVVIGPASSLELESAETAQLSASLEDPRGRTLSGRAVTWSSDDPLVASVTEAGLVQALRAGRATITATSEGVSAARLVDVLPAPSYDLIYDRPSGAIDSEILILGLTGGAAPVRIDAGDVSRRPSPSPDGSRFAFAQSYHHPQYGWWVHDVFVADRNGMNLRQLTSLAGVETDPAWSPDGERIAFTGINIATGRSDVFVIDADGTGLVNLTAGLHDLTHAVQPAWSPDGARLAFVAMIGPDPSQSRIWTMRADGSQAAPIEADWPGVDQHPTWSPAGDRIAFQRYLAAEGRTHIAIVSTAGGPALRLNLPGQQFQPAWSPDPEADYIAFALRLHDDAERTELYTVRPDGSGLRLRTTNPGWRGGGNPQWIRR